MAESVIIHFSSCYLQSSGLISTELIGKSEGRMDKTSPPGLSASPACHGHTDPGDVADLLRSHPHEEDPVRNHPDAPLAKHCGELSQRHGRLGAQDVEEHDHEVDAGLAVGHPAEVGPQTVVLEVAEPLEHEQVDPRQGEREPDDERDVRVDLEHDDLLAPCEHVDLLRGTRDAARMLHVEVRDEQGDREHRVDADDAGECVVHGSSPFLFAFTAWRHANGGRVSTHNLEKYFQTLRRNPKQNKFV